MVGKWSKHRREAKNEIKEIPMKIRLQMKKSKAKASGGFFNTRNEITVAACRGGTGATSTQAK